MAVLFYRGVSSAPLQGRLPVLGSRPPGGEWNRMNNPRSERKWHVRKIGLHDEDNMAIDRAVALDMTADERLAQAWWMTTVMGGWTGVDYSQRRLQRSVVQLQRRER
jgi:hypothetical protein